jgi:hypothetical protein
VLLARNEPRIEVKNKALAQAVERRKNDTVKLLVEQGASALSIAFVDVFRTWDPQVIQYFLARGADVVTDKPFAGAIGEKVRSSLRTFKQCQESHPELAGELKQQAERALRLFRYEGNLKWVSLMLWVGADPRVKGPRLDAHSEDDPECDATAIEEACLSGKLDARRNNGTYF